MLTVDSIRQYHYLIIFTVLLSRYTVVVRSLYTLVMGMNVMVIFDDFFVNFHGRLNCMEHMFTDFTKQQKFGFILDFL